MRGPITRYAERIRGRYLRPVIAGPGGVIVHMGDCRVFGTKICTCGLLDDLARNTEGARLYPQFHAEHAEHMAALDEVRERQL